MAGPLTPRLKPSRTTFQEELVRASRFRRALVGTALGALVLSMLPAAGALADGHAVDFSEVCEGADDATFPDIGSTHADAISCMNAYTDAQGDPIIRGFEDGTFGTQDNIERQQFASLVYRFATVANPDLDVPDGDHPFTDVTSTTHDPAIEALYNLGLVDGTTATTFSPNDDLTRSQAAGIIFDAHVALGVDFDDEYPETDFTDLGTTFQAEIEALTAEGIIAGETSTTFGYSNPVERGQIATLLARSAQVLLDAGLWAGELPVDDPDFTNETFTDAPELVTVSRRGDNVLVYEFDANVTGEALEVITDGDDIVGYPGLRVYDEEGGIATPTEASITGNTIAARYTSDELGTSTRATARFDAAEGVTGLPSLEGAVFMQPTATPITADPFWPDLIAVDNYRTAPTQPDGTTPVQVDFTFGLDADDEGLQDAIDNDMLDDHVLDLLGIDPEDEGDADQFVLIGAQGSDYEGVDFDQTVITDSAATFTIEFDAEPADLPESQLRRGLFEFIGDADTAVADTDVLWLAENYGVTGGETVDPDLVQVTREDATTYRFVFDQPVSAVGDDLTAASFNVYSADGNVFDAHAVQRTNIPDEDASVVYASINDEPGSATGNPLDTDAGDNPPVGAFVSADAVVGTTIGAGANQPDQVNLELPAPDVDEVEAGATGYLDIESVTRRLNTVTGQYSVVFTFSDDSTPQGGDVAFDLYDEGGTQFRAVRNVPTGTGSVTFSPGEEFDQDQILAAVVGAVETETPEAGASAGQDATGITVASEGAVQIGDDEF